MKNDPFNRRKRIYKLNNLWRLSFSSFERFNFCEDNARLDIFIPQQTIARRHFYPPQI